ncbi:putative endopeptidase precursor [Streptomyces sp. ADI96-02]|uniref:C40 family peptidase n=1 Tax=unclassified Streptomyces TaxID=2593676 RepID=UPI000F559322|nr:NlpC/P60 family protein [Streptomyces sp. ADI96-02]RPK69255.1 putative endopeptidase precursor [Streptomyces sp. ADI96-02]
MASHRRPKQSNHTYASVLTATAAVSVVMSAQSASADPLPDPNKKGVQAQIDRLYEEATQATEKYNGAKEAADELQGEADNLQDTVARKQGDLNELRRQLGSVATAQYRSGGLDPSVQLLFSADPDAYLDRASGFDRLSARQSETLERFLDQQRALQQQRSQAGEKLESLDDTRRELGNKKKEIQGKLAEAQRLLNTLTAKERSKIAAEEERANRSSERVELGDEPSASGRTASAFDAAKSRVGMPYVWGAAGPGSFDCSGLTSWAFRQAGVSLPRTSQEQANAGTRINSLSALKPGDLIIMRTDLSHVGFYAGNGQILHSPKPGAQVRYESIARSGMPFMWGVRI